MANCAVADGDLLIGVDVRSAGKNGYVQTFVFVVATNLRVVKAAMLRLRIPVGLQRYRCEPARCASAFGSPRAPGKCQVSRR